MTLPTQISVWDLWSELARNTEPLGDPLFLECLEVASNNRIFDDLADDKLKASLSILNSLLNDPKTKQKGLTLFNDFATQINPARLIGFQDAVISSLHLVVKGLDSPVAHTALVNFLPKCHCMSEVNQVVTASIVPKILSFFVEENHTSILQRSVEEFTLLKVCLLEYHGPCGQVRDKLERIMMPLIDSENSELIREVSEVLPLISYAGGGGNAGEKHIKDWNSMLTKCLKTTYSTLVQMYGDSCPSLEPDNPFDGDHLTGLKRIIEPQVLLRLSLLKRRLQNLLTLISGYLRYPFPVPKLVPQKGILKLLTCLTSVVPPSPTRNSNGKIQTKENAFLTAITPGAHVLALNLLRSLFDCVGSNIFTEAVAMEQMLSSEFKWLQEKPRAFEKLKLELYTTVSAWLALSGGSVSNQKTLSLWTNAIGIDSRVEKDVVELKVLSKPKPGKSVKLMSSSSMTLSSGSTTRTFVQKSPTICQAALKTLTRLIPVLDMDNHRKIYGHLLKTFSIICQFQCPPSPYDNPECRQLIYKNISKLCHHPQPQSPISISLLVAVLKRGMYDPTKLVSTFCANEISQLERLLHPISAPLMLAGPVPHPVILNNSNIIDFGAEDQEKESVSEDESNVPAQNESNVTVTANPAIATTITENDVITVFKEKMEQTLKDLLANYPIIDVQNRIVGEAVIRGSENSKESHANQEINANSTTTSSEMQCSGDDVVSLQEDDDSQSVGADVVSLQEYDDSQSQSGIIANGNGYHTGKNREELSEDELKRKADDDDNIEHETSKKIKTHTPNQPIMATVVDGPTVEEMLSAFVDAEPVA